MLFANKQWRRLFDKLLKSMFYCINMLKIYLLVSTDYLQNSVGQVGRLLVKQILINPFLYMFPE